MIRLENHDGRIVLEGAAKIALPTVTEGIRVINWLKTEFSD